MSIRIITDSASDVFRDKYPLLEVLPMTITFGEEQFLDGVNLSREEFYLKLVETDAMPLHQPRYLRMILKRRLSVQGRRATRRWL